MHRWLCTLKRETPNQWALVYVSSSWKDLGGLPILTHTQTGICGHLFETLPAMLSHSGSDGQGREDMWVSRLLEKSGFLSLVSIVSVSLGVTSE